jgi:deoxyribonuclease-4
MPKTLNDFRHPLLGAHMSISGGVHTAVERGMSIGCRTMQIFVKNNTQWRVSPLTDEQILTYKNLLMKSTIAPVIVHSTYLINMAATDNDMLRKSRELLVAELERCERLDIPYYNLHPGNHLGAGESEGIQKIAESINLMHNQVPFQSTKTVLETTAGQGTSIGHRFEHLRAIIDLVEQQDRMAVCVDTCHIYAAGYDITNEQGYESTWREFESVIGLARLAAFHMNDSKRECGSRVDRHEHIGKGKMGLKGFRLLMNDPRFEHLPKILETPKGKDMKEDVINMKTLRRLVKRK